MALDQPGPGENGGPGPRAQGPAEPVDLPVLYSFRRCPYAIRARLALAAAGLRPGCDLVVREVNLGCKPPELLLAAPKGTVPVLVVPPQADADPQGEATVIDQSLALMYWALARGNPGDWLRGGTSPAARANRAEQAGLIAENDGPFKHHLDRFKYPDRFAPRDSVSASAERPAGNAAGRSAANPCGELLGEPQQHRAAALKILRGWNRRLSAGGWLLGQAPCLADWALLPFVRQFRRADPAGFDAEANLEALQVWLGRFESCSEFAAVMETPWGPRQPWRSPRWLYHLALADEWRQARTAGLYARSTRGQSLEQVGFIHASYAHQLAATYSRFYGDAGPVVLLTLDPARLEQAGVAVRAEPAGATPGARAISIAGAGTLANPESTAASSPQSNDKSNDKSCDEPSRELFPHLYGPLPLTAVLAAVPYQQP